MLPLPLSLTPFSAGFFALEDGPCLPIVGSGLDLLGLVVLILAIFGAGTVGGTAREKGVFAGVEGGVGGRPIEGFTSSLV